MASLCISSFAAPPIAGNNHNNPIILHRPPKNLSPISSNFGIKGPLRWRRAKGYFAAHASNPNPSETDSGNKKSGGNSDSAAQGPPFLTILAGFAVFFIVFWIIKSIVLGFIGLFVKLASSN